MAKNDVNLSLMDGDIMMDEHIKNIKELINSAKLPKMDVAVHRGSNLPNKWFSKQSRIER